MKKRRWKSHHPTKRLNHDMDYFGILNLNREPFSNSPDPDYFFHSQQHVGCLQKLELSLRLRRGLNVVIGEVGTGKTTLCRQLIRRFSDDQEIETHLILDPYFSTPNEFLITVTEMITGETPETDANDYQLKERIKQNLFTKGVDENKTVVLIIDEGQKIPVFCLEILREFLNYETNNYKLLQIAIFAQKEFDNTLQEHANFADRINLYHLLEPMNFRDTRSMIQYRLKQSSTVNKKIALFTYPALWVIYHATQGYPRKIVNLCHRSILAMIIQNKSKANFFLVQSCIRRAFESKKKRSWQYAIILLLVLIGATIYVPRWLPQQKKMPVASETVSQKIPTPVVKNKIPDTPVEKDVQPIDVVTQAPLATAASTAASKDNSSQSIATVSIESQKHIPTPNETRTTQTGSVASKSPPAEVSANVNNPPGVLGHLRVKRRETLGGLIQQIYGVFSSAYLQSVMRVNPHISDPDTIDVGEIILFPAIPSHVTQQPLKHWWVEIANDDGIEDVFRLLRKYPPESPSARLIPYWNRSSGLHFSILLTQYFYDEASAQNKMKSLSSRIASNGRIVSEWDKHTVFYANPYQKYNK